MSFSFCDKLSENKCEGMLRKILTMENEAWMTIWIGIEGKIWRAILLTWNVMRDRSTDFPNVEYPTVSPHPSSWLVDLSVAIFRGKCTLESFILNSSFFWHLASEKLEMSLRRWGRLDSPLVSIVDDSMIDSDLPLRCSWQKVESFGVNTDAGE